MARLLMNLILGLFFYLPWGERQTSINHLTAIDFSRSAKQMSHEKKSRDFSSFKALKMYSLPAEKLVKPAYLPEAKERKITGTALVKVIVDTKG